MPDKLTRRDIFKLIAATGLIVPLSYCAGVSFGGYDAVAGLKVLTEKQAAILKSVIEVIIPDPNPLGVSAADIDLIHQLDNFVGEMPSYNRHQIEVLLGVVEHLFPMRRLYFRKFTRLTLEHRRKILESLDEGGAGGRALVRALKGLVQAVYYNDPRVGGAIGFARSCK